MRFIWICICSSHEKYEQLNHVQKSVLIISCFDFFSPCHLVSTALLPFIYMVMPCSGLEGSLNNAFVRVVMQEKCRNIFRIAFGELDIVSADPANVQDENNGWITAILSAGRKHKIAHTKRPHAFKTYCKLLYLFLVICSSLIKKTTPKPNTQTCLKKNQKNPPPNLKTQSPPNFR